MNRSLEFFRSLQGIFLLLLVLSPQSQARPEYQAKIPNGANVPNWPGVGHLKSGGGGPRNVFGLDFQAANFTWTKQLCEKDSDGDGFSNGLELGDPHCTWYEGGPPPLLSTGLSHPGFKDQELVPTYDSCKNYTKPVSAQQFNITMPAYTIPATETTYARKLFNFTTAPGLSGGFIDSNLWALRFTPIINHVSKVHHILLYGCTTTEANNILASHPVQPTTAGIGCASLIFAWATGGFPFCFPPNVALFLDRTKPTVLMEMHYDNPNNESGVVDSSGFMVDVLTPAPSPSNDPQRAAFIMTGVNIPKTNVAPGKQRYQIKASLPFPFGISSLPKTSINIIGALGHAHYLGRKIFATAESSVGDPTRLLQCDPTYSNSLQELRAYKDALTLSNKDTITVHCIFDSSNKTTWTSGGESTSQEMCLVFLLYYPYIGFEFALMTNTPEYSNDSSLSTAIACETPATNYAGQINEQLGGYTAPSYVTSHAVLCAIGLGALLPVGTLIPAMKKFRATHKKWVYLHAGLVMSGYVLGFAGFFVIMKEDTGTSPMKGGLRMPTTIHGKLGIAIIIIAVVQILMGLFRPHVPKPGEEQTTQRFFFELIHPNLGRGILAIIIAQLVYGYDLLGKSYTASQSQLDMVNAWFGVHMAFFGLLALIVVVFKLLPGPEKNNAETAEDGEKAVAVNATENPKYQSA